MLGRMTDAATNAPTLEGLVQQGWQDHARDAAGVLARLPNAIDLVKTPAHALSLAGLAVHVAGEHLGLWDEGIGLVERIRGLALADDPAERSLCRSLAILHLCRGDEAAAARFLAAGRSGGDVPEASDQARVLATVASAFVGQRRIGEAAAAFQSALQLVAYGPGPKDPAARALAVTGNNLAAELSERAGRTEAETELMLEAARCGRRFWEVAGGWREVERAEYRLALCHLAAGEATDALAHARACLHGVREHGDEPLELFFAHEALARVKKALGQPTADDRAACAAALAGVEAGDRGWLEGELAKLDVRLR